MQWTIRDGGRKEGREEGSILFLYLYLEVVWTPQCYSYHQG